MAPPDKLYEEPTNAFVADFIGDNNCLHGTVTSETEKSCVVKTSDGSEIQANKINIAGVGQRSTLSIRPERVIVSPEEGQVPNIFEAKAAELIYLGDHIRTRMEVCGTDDFYVKIPNSSHQADLNEGDIVKIGWNEYDCRALDASD